MTFRAGDSVHHGPTGEDWVLAFGDLEDGGGKVSPAGWPACLAEASDCTLLEPASDEEHIEMLKRVADMRGSDFRAIRAQNYLASLPKEGTDHE